MADKEYFNMMLSSFVFFLLFSCVLCLGQEFEEKCAAELKGCYCTDMYIDCSGADFTDIKDIYPYITDKTYRIHITGGRIRTIPNDLFVTDSVSGPLNNVVYLNLSGNSIETVGKTSFQQLPNLQVLDLSYNDISVNLCEPQNDVSESLAPLVNIEELYLGHVFSKAVSGSCDPGNVFPQAALGSLKKLDLSSNSFDVIGKNLQKFLCDKFSIETLNMSGNNFYGFPVSQCMTNIVELDVSNNQISVLTPEDIDVIMSLVNLKSLRLGGNLFTCDCYLDNTFNWLNSTDLPLDFNKIVCGGDTNDKNLIGKPITSLNFKDMCEEPRIIVCYGPGGRKLYLSKTSFIAGLSGAAVLVVCVIAVIVVICRRRRRHRMQQRAGTNSQILPDVAKSTTYSRMI